MATPSRSSFAVNSETAADWSWRLRQVLALRSSALYGCLLPQYPMYLSLWKNQAVLLCAHHFCITCCMRLQTTLGRRPVLG